AFLLEGGSTWAAFKEFKAAKGSLGWFEAVRRSKDPPGFIVLLENGAAMVGLVAAAAGLMLSQLTGDPFYDGAASVVIGIVLGLTAFLLAVESKALLIGEAAEPEIVEGLRKAAAGRPGIAGIGRILTIPPRTRSRRWSASISTTASALARSSGWCAKSRNRWRANGRS
ncbi:MAG TPA: hypothetical protein VF652_03090, partial [Allosphingosinicella sp.]